MLKILNIKKLFWFRLYYKDIIIIYEGCNETNNLESKFGQG